MDNKRVLISRGTVVINVNNPITSPLLNRERGSTAPARPLQVIDPDNKVQEKLVAINRTKGVFPQAIFLILLFA